MGKGSKRRPFSRPLYAQGYDTIFGPRPKGRSTRGSIHIGRADKAWQHKQNTGAIVSVHAGVGQTQIVQANEMMLKAGVNATFDGQGTMHAPSRTEYLKALRVRGLHNNDEIRG